MIVFSHGDIFTSGAEALVNPVNCVGDADKGLALQFKQRFPDNFRHYKIACENNRVPLTPGRLLVTDYGSERVISASWGGLLPGKGSNVARYIVNFPTKLHWRDKSSVDYIMEGLDALVKFANEEKPASIAIPPLVDWKDVSRLIEEAASLMPDSKIICLQSHN